MEYIISQIFGISAYSLLAYSFFKKKKKQILYVQILAYVAFTLHYALIGALTGTVCNIIGGIALILIYFFSEDEKKKKILVSVLIVLLMIMAVLSYEDIFSIFPAVACLITFISFLTKNENVIRFIGIISAFFWFIYELVQVSYIAIVFEAITVISTMIAYSKNKKD